MGADMKTLRSRIRSVDSTLHLTRAMGLVASSKLRRANEAMRCGREYAAAVRTVVRQLTGCRDCQKSPYLRGSGGEKTALVVIAGDRGMCGGYNANIFRLLRELPEAEIIPIGKRACDRFGGEPTSSEQYTEEEGWQLAKSLCEAFAAGRIDRLGIVSTRYRSVLTQEAQVEWVLPLQRTEPDGAEGLLFEPDELTVLAQTVPTYLSGLLMAAVRESFACEVAARRNAMDSAQKNAEEMIEGLTLQYNRARQGAITQEITEIVAGSGG